ATTAYTYDGLGNRVRKIDRAGTTNFLVDPFGHGGTRLAIENGSCCSGVHQGNLPAGARPESGSMGLAQMMSESDALGTAISDYVYGGLTLVSQRRGTDANAVSFYLSDGQRSTRGLTDAAGAVTDTYDYNAFGELLAQT